MRNLVVYVTVGVLLLLLLLVVLIPYGLTFSGPLSRSSQAWADFGTYIGGVVTPLALLGTILTLAVNEKHRNSEFKRIADESLRGDLWRAMERIEEKLGEELSGINVNLICDSRTLKYSGHDVLSRKILLEWEQAIPTHNEVRAILDSEENFDRAHPVILSFASFSDCTMQINRLRQHVLEYERVAGNNVEALYFKRKYALAVERLAKRGYAVESWDDVAQQHAARDV